jgi:hypothetical protein
MAADPFNSVGGYTIGIPPITILDSNGNLTVPKANIAGNLYISNNLTVAGDISATNFVGNLQGNISANITITGSDGALVFNNNGLAETAEGVIYDKPTQSLTVSETLYANNFALGSGVNQFYEITSFIATTSSTTANQVLHRIPANTICGAEYTIIATDAIANTRQISKLNAIVLGSDVGYSEFGTADSPVASPGVGDFRVNFAVGGPSGNVTLTVTPQTSNSTTYKILIISYKA